MLFSEINNPVLEVIAGTECIGDSLFKINTNTERLSSYVLGLQSDIIASSEQFNTELINSQSVLTRVQTLSSELDQWSTLNTFVRSTSSYIFDSYDLAVNSVSKNTLLPSSILSGSNLNFSSITATNITATNVKNFITTTRYISSLDTAVGSITATGFYHGDGSKLIGIVAPTRVYVRFNGSTINLPDQSSIPTGYWGTNYNVSSITKVGTGIYRVNFARSIEDYRYAYFLCSGGGSTPYVACRAPYTNASIYDITILNKRLSDNITVDAEEMNVMILYPQSR